ncbi:MAG: hypothetical protein H5U03_09600, partial [Clostridia bacterium]|nr:hypothetical protein [Clostridia bacterium]
SENLGHAARQLLALWRPAMPKVSLPPEPVTSFPSEPSEKSGATPPPSVPSGAITLAELFDKIKRKEIPPGSKPPTLLFFPDGKTHSVTYWIDLLTGTVKWLAEKGRLPVPIKRQPSGHNLVNTTPEGMRKPTIKVQDYYVERPFSHSETLRFLLTVLNAAGMDPKEFRVVLRD